MGKKDMEREARLFQRFPTARAYGEKIRPLLSEKRYRHSVNVAYEAVVLAERVGADVQKAAEAGILHDCMKDTPPLEQLAMVQRAGMHLTELELGAKKLYHAVSGTAYLKEVLHITDPEILNAVRYHTSGRPAMSTLEKLIFLSDMLEPGRDFPKVDKLRAYFAKDLNECMFRALDHQIKYLRKGKGEIYPLSFRAYEYYKNLRRN